MGVRWGQRSGKFETRGGHVYAPTPKGGRFPMTPLANSLAQGLGTRGSFKPVLCGGYIGGYRQKSAHKAHVCNMLGGESGQGNTEYRPSLEQISDQPDSGGPISEMGGWGDGGGQESRNLRIRGHPSHPPPWRQPAAQGTITFCHRVEGSSVCSTTLWPERGG